jgi:uncharacterized membrane protein SpoIIM required for sporulation
MIIDLERFAAAEKHYWNELETQLDLLEGNPHHRLDLPQAERLHYLYQRAASDLARLATFSAEPELRRSLSALVARAYSEIQSGGGGADASRLRPWQWVFQTFPRTFRRHVRAFWLSLAITLVGCGFGGAALSLDSEAKEIILPFSHLLGDPNERVAEEEQNKGETLSGHKTTFSASLMSNNIRVSMLALALGATWAVGTIVLLFYNGVILGAVAFDYLRAGQGTFLLGWLLPHGSVEIPSILLAGQAGLILGGAIIGWGRRAPLGQRLRAVRTDLVTLIGGVALMLVWAGIVEAFFSQYHAPVLPYSFKIAFGSVELLLLTLFLWRSGQEEVAASNLGAVS